MDAARACWDAVWQRQEIISDYTLRWYAYLEGVARSLLPDKKVILETGSGSGRGIGVFARDGHDCFGLDSSEVAVRKARIRHPCVRFSRTDVFDMPFEDEKFDVVFNSGLIEHFKYPGNVDAVKAMTRILKPGGRLIMAVPNRLCLWYVLGKKLMALMGIWPYGFEDSYSPGLLKRYVREAGRLEIDRVFGIQPLPMLATPRFELIPIRFRRTVMALEAPLPAKHYYSYAIVIESTKTMP